MSDSFDDNDDSDGGGENVLSGKKREKLAASDRGNRKNAAVALDDTNHGERRRQRINTREMGLRDSIILFVAKECGGVD